MSNSPFIQLQEKYLRKMYVLSKGIPMTQINNRIYELHEIVPFNGENYEGLTKQLEKKGWANFQWSGYTWITAEGVEKVENDMATLYAEQELLVLKTVYELSELKPRDGALFSDVLQKTGLTFVQLNEIYSELQNRKGYLTGGTDEHMKVTPEGKEFLQGKSNMKDTRNINNTTYISGQVHNLQQFTKDSVINSVVIHAPSSVPDDLLGQITLLRAQLKEISRAEEADGRDSSDYDEAVGAVTSAQKALMEGNESKAKTYLLTGGKFVADFASKLGVNLVTEFIKQNINS